MAEFFKRAVFHSDIFTYFLASVLFILIYIAINVEKKKEKLNSKKIEEIFLINKTNSQTIPMVTYWFPLAVPVLDGIITLLRIRNEGVAIMDTHQTRFGKVYKFFLGNEQFLMVNDVSLIQKVLTSTNSHHLNKPEIYDSVFVNSMRDGLVNSKFPVWSSHRKFLMHCFSYSCLQNYLKSINKHGKDLIRCLNDVMCNGEIADSKFIHQTFHFHLVKIITEIVIGSTSLSDDITVDFAKKFAIAKHGVFAHVLNPFLRIPLLRYFNRNLNNQLNAIHSVDNFFKNITKKHRSDFEKELVSSQHALPIDIEADIGIKPYRCLIQEMIYRGATNKEITDQVATFMIAGHESTHIALQMLMLHMALNLHHQSCCQNEIDELMLQKNHNDLNDLDFNFKDISKLKYLERCVSESARITPTFPMFARKLDASLKISDDLELPPGTNIVIPVWAIHRDQDNFPNPEIFDPDRFLPENVKQRHPYSYIPFSSGPRNCIASKLALMEIKVIMAFILLHFEIHSNDKLEDVKLFVEVTIKPERCYNIVLKRRQM